MQQELTFAARRVIRPRTPHVRSDVHGIHPHFAVVDIAVAINERRAALAQRLHLGALEDHAGFPRRIDVVVVARLFIRGDELLFSLRRYGRLLLSGLRGHVHPSTPADTLTA